MPDMNTKRKILVIDDDDINLYRAENLLKDEFAVTTAESGKKALELIYKNYIPGLILLDIIMPEMDGWETYHRLKAISFLHDVPIVFLTSLEGATDRKYAEDLGAAGYITKPCSKEDLLKNLKTILKEREK